MTGSSSSLELPSAIPGFPDFGHITFEGLPNTRDLGGMPAADGRRIKPGCLLRSGALHHAASSDLERLRADLHLACVVDLRTTLEREKDPDPYRKLPQTAFYDLPVLTGEAVGVTHEGDLGEELKKLAGTQIDIHRIVRSIYEHALVSPAGRIAYGSFLTIALENPEGAILWHCTEGKDRAGLAAVVIERALGVTEQNVKADYLATNLFVRNHLEKMMDELAEKIPGLRGLDNSIDAAFYAFSDYFASAMASIDEAYGSFDAYLEKGLSFGPDKQAALRAKYLG